MSLFLSYQGRLLEVTAETDAWVKEWFPGLDAQSEYREADAWLWAAPPSKRPKNVRRFLRNWLQKSVRAQKEMAKKESAVRAELNVGVMRGTR